MIKTYDKEMVIAFAEINNMFNRGGELKVKAKRAVYKIKRFMGIS